MLLWVLHIGQMRHLTYFFASSDADLAVMFKRGYRMIKEIQEAIECWASKPTWFTSHPIDASNLREAVSNLKKLDFPPTEVELKEAIFIRVKDLPAMLGTPNNIEKAAEEFAIKIR